MVACENCTYRVDNGLVRVRKAWPLDASTYLLQVLAGAGVPPKYEDVTALGSPLDGISRSEEGHGRYMKGCRQVSDSRIVADK